MRTVRRLSLTVAVVMVLALVALPAPAEASSVCPLHASAGHAPSQQGPKALTVMVSRHGFNGSPDGLRLQVQEGEEVEITFVYADMDMHRSNAHRIKSTELGIDTGEIDKDNPQATVKFVARRTGTFVLVCVLNCDGHKNLENGRLEVLGSARPLAITKTAVALSAPAVARSGETIALSARATDDAGKPLASAPVRFYVHSDFFIQEPMLIGEALSDAEGTARIEYTPRSVGGHHAVVARFDGDSRHAGSEATTTLTVEDRGQIYRSHAGIETPPLGPTLLGVTPGGPSYSLEQIPLPTLDWGPLVLFGILASIWGTYLLVVFQVFQIGRGGGLVRLLPSAGLVVVFLLATMLLVVILRNPYTHLHLPP